MTYSIIYVLSLVLYAAVLLFFVSCTIVRSGKLKLYFPFVIVAFLICFTAAFVLNLLFLQAVWLVVEILFNIALFAVFIILRRHAENDCNC